MGSCLSLLIGLGTLLFLVFCLTILFGKYPIALGTLDIGYQSNKVSVERLDDEELEPYNLTYVSCTSDGVF